jgi:hypothetical protein
MFTPFAFIQSAAVVPIDPDAQAFFDATGITNPTQQTAINNLVIGLKGDNLWAKMIAIYPFVGGTATTHKYNLKDPRDLDAAYRISFTGGWTHSEANGIVPNGTDTIGDTFYQGTGVDNDFALSYWTTTTTMQPNTGGLGTFGATIGASNTYVIIANRTGVNWASNLGDDDEVAIQSFSDVGQTGMLVGSRTSATSNKVYRNGTLLVTNTGTQTGSWPARNIVFGSPDGVNVTTMNSLFASISTGLTDSEVSDFYTTVNTYQTELGR